MDAPEDQQIIWQEGRGPFTLFSWADHVANGEIEALRGCKDSLGSHSEPGAGSGFLLVITWYPVSG